MVIIIESLSIDPLSMMRRVYCDLLIIDEVAPVIPFQAGNPEGRAV